MGREWHLHWVFRGATYAGINGEASVVQSMASESELLSELADRAVAKRLAANVFCLPYLSLQWASDLNWSGTTGKSGPCLHRASIQTFSSVMRV